MFLRMVSEYELDPVYEVFFAVPEFFKFLYTKYSLRSRRLQTYFRYIKIQKHMWYSNIARVINHTLYYLASELCIMHIVKH